MESPSGDTPIYAEVGKHPLHAKRQLRDQEVVTFDHPNMAVFPSGLMTLDDRYGMEPVPEMAALAPTSGSHVNATLLPAGGLHQRLVQFAAPGAADSAMGRLRGAKLGCALLEQQVGQVVTVKDPTARTAVLGDHFQTQVKARGGPLDVGMKAGPVAGDAPRTLQLRATLPSGVKEDSGTLGLWELNRAMTKASMEGLSGTFKALHEASEGLPVAFGCQSGNSRSGVAALLYFQRAMAEQIFGEGKTPNYATLMEKTLDWDTSCKRTRSPNFADRMEKGLLQEHARLLASEFTERADTASASAPQPRPDSTELIYTTVEFNKPAASPLPSPKPSYTEYAELQPSGGSSDLPQALATSPPPRPDRPAPSKPGVPPPPPPKPGVPPPPPPKPGVQASAAGPAKKVGPQVPPKPTSTAPGATSVAASASGPSQLDGGLYSTATVRRSWTALPTAHVTPHVRTSQESSYAHLGQSGTAAPGNIYGMGSASVSTPVNDDDSVYDTVDVQRRSAGESNWSRDRLKRSSVKLAAKFQNRPPAPPTPTKTADTAWAMWASNKHEQSAKLDDFINSITSDFCQKANQGFRFFASKKTYGVGKGVENVKTQAAQSAWSGLAEALHDSNERAEQLGDMQGTLMQNLFTSKLQRHFDELPSQTQKKWMDRSTSRGTLEDAVNTAKSELNALDKMLDMPNANLEEIKERLLGTEMTHLALLALHEVGQRNKR